MDTEMVYIERKGISGSTIKWIAIITMAIDHFAAIVLTNLYYATFRQMGGGQQADMVVLEQQRQSLEQMIGLLRGIGRIGFPLFCFLLLEGFLHTKNVKKYISRMVVFALLSEIPFDLGFRGSFFDWGYQNVFFTLLAGLLAILIMSYIQEKAKWNVCIKIPAMLFSVAAVAFLAEWLRTDYGLTGVLTIVIMYLFRKNKTIAVGAGSTVLTALLGTVEAPAFLAMIPVHFYNGKRGWNMKYFFYLFYPLHIILFYLLSLWMIR